jgi:hypothetical protein
MQGGRWRASPPQSWPGQGLVGRVVVVGVVGAPLALQTVQGAGFRRMWCSGLGLGGWDWGAGRWWRWGEGALIGARGDL